ncbi:putative muramidase [Aspergillus bombycis]|uniref:Putative muramidase n=1 Tax=Aspergillus bombycis TaxID=109264 RepID=A0A1F8ABG8_9EURO|nr:putative muramidase [Aspergillus bombycis]OGM49023.1 putative muramidase [Aspergillus bombycis]
MAPFQLTLSLLLVVIATSGNAASTTWETHPSHPTLPGTAPNCNKWYTAKKGDDCSTVQRDSGISADDFFGWNPSVSKDCKKNFWADTSYCVGVGPAITTGTPTPTGLPSTTTPRQSTETTPISSGSRGSGTSISAPSSSPTTKATYTFNHPTTTWTPSPPAQETAWPPTKTQPGQPTSCTRWHEVMIGDTCDTITSRYSSWITKEDLLEWNPGLQEDCDAPLVGYFLCVMTRPSGYSVTYSSGSTPVVIPTPTPYTRPPPVCPNTTETELTPSPTQPGMPSKCQIYYHATTGDSCSKILSQYNMPEKLLHEWNPALGPDCKGLLPNYYYCLLPSGFFPMPLTVTTAPAPTQTGITSNCKAWYRSNKSETCSDIVLAFGTFSEEDFKAWNPAVGQRCTGLIDGNWYCVAMPGTPSTRTAPVPAFPTSVPRQPNVIKNCTSWWHVSDEDDCYDVARKNGITVDDFLAWNPDVRAGQYDCKALPVDHEICVGVRPKPPIRGCTPTGTNTTASANTTVYPTTRTSWHRTLTTTTVVTQCEDASSSTCATATVTTTRVVTLSPPPTATPIDTTFVTSPTQGTNSSSGASSPVDSTLPPSSSCASSNSPTPIVPSTTGPRESSSWPTSRPTRSQDPHSSVTESPPPAAPSTITVTTTITTQCSTMSTLDTSSPDDTTLVTATVTTHCSTSSVSSTSSPEYTEIETTTLTTRCSTTSPSQTASEPSMTIMRG